VSDFEIDLKHDEIIKSLVKGYKNGKSNVTVPLPEYMHYVVDKQADSAIFLAKMLGFDTSFLSHKFQIFFNKDFEKLLDEHGLLDDKKNEGD
jgi:hypothetical protein